MPYPDLFHSDKRIAVWPGWSKPEPETGYCWFMSPLEIGGVIEADFALHGGTYIDRPEQHVTFELKVGKTGVRRKVPLARVCWRSLTGGHTNRRGPTVPWAGKRVGESHVHGFDINWLESEGRMRTDLSQAEPFSQEIESFEELRRHVGILFRISNIDIVDRPQWEYKLL